VNVPKDLKYTPTHEWCKVDGKSVTVGLTDYAQSELGDIVFLQLPGVGTAAKKGAGLVTIEAVKTVADLFSPLDGKVTAVNGALDSDPQKINQDCYGDGWILKLEVTDPSQLNGLLDAGSYSETLH